MSEMEETQSSKVGMTAIIVTGVVAISAWHAGVAIAFILNAPW